MTVYVLTTLATVGGFYMMGRYFGQQKTKEDDKNQQDRKDN